MDTESWYQEKLASVKDDFDFRFDSLVLDITETIRLKLKKNRTTITKLAERLNVTPAAVSKLLRGESNFTIKKLMEVADAIELDLKVELTPKQKEKVSPHHKPLSQHLAPVYVSAADVYVKHLNPEEIVCSFVSPVEQIAVGNKKSIPTAVSSSTSTVSGEATAVA